MWIYYLFIYLCTILSKTFIMRNCQERGQYMRNSVLSFQVFWKYKTDLKHKAYYKNSDNKNKWSFIKIPLIIFLSLLNWDTFLSLYPTIIYRKYSM